MFQFKRDFESAFCGARSLGFSRALNPSMKTFETWLDENRGRIPVEKGARRASGEWPFRRISGKERDGKEPGHSVK